LFVKSFFEKKGRFFLPFFLVAEPLTADLPLDFTAVDVLESNGFFLGAEVGGEVFAVAEVNSEFHNHFSFVVWGCSP
jgi:hypothetical protein